MATKGGQSASLGGADLLNSWPLIKIQKCQNNAHLASL
jgi:hypothetical protein